MSETQAERDAADTTVIYCGKCNGARMVIITTIIEDGERREIGEMVAAGCGATHMPVTQARAQAWCECK